MDEKRLVNGSIWKGLALFALPTFFVYLSTYLYNAFDIFILYLSGAGDEISAVMSALTPISLVTAILTGLSAGGTFLIGQYYGANDKANTKKAIITFTIFITALAITLAALIAIFVEPIVGLMHIDSSLIDKAIRYLLIQCITIPFIGLVYIVNAAFRGTGNSIFPFIYTFLGLALNIIFDVIFVYALNMKSDGAALACVLSFVISSLVALIYIFFFKLKGIKIGKISIDFIMIKRIIKFSWPLAVQEALVIISFIVLVSVINIRGPSSSEVIAISDRITNIAYVPTLSIGMAIQAAVAQNLGAFKVDRAKKVLWVGISYIAILTLVYALPIVATSGIISSIYTGDIWIQNENLYRSLIIGIDIILCIFLTPLNNLASGSGYSNWSLYCYLFSDLLIRIPWIIISGLYNMPIWFVTLSYPASTILGLIILIIFYKSKKWKNLKKLPVAQEILDEINQTN
ncbi:MAG: MATE family efflux transporter [Erysipelotrichaceae bacterium]|jgi:putative MATE family efflux protein|nr:MATE family efflux transporter [Erysipelotrichaceae bacterium]